jgi:dTDP-4-dehydrorhamnose 3,5-epimerase
MTSSPTALPGVLLLTNFVSNDKRGVFVKTFHAPQFQQQELATDFRESYYSISHRDVIRGMHFQLPPHEHDKLVYVTQGEILDVIIDLRRGSATFGQHVALRLVEHTQAVYIPRGCAHGFLTLSDTATVVYNVTSVYEPTADAGIRWDSFGFEWPVQQPIISDRDAAFGTLAELPVSF